MLRVCRKETESLVGTVGKGEDPTVAKENTFECDE